MGLYLAISKWAIKGINKFIRRLFFLSRKRATYWQRNTHKPKGMEESTFVFLCAYVECVHVISNYKQAWQCRDNSDKNKYITMIIIRV